MRSYLSLIKQNSITAIADVRNNAAHGSWEELSVPMRSIGSQPTTYGLKVRMSAAVHEAHSAHCAKNCADALRRWPT